DGDLDQTPRPGDRRVQRDRPRAGEAVRRARLRPADLRGGRRDRGSRRGAAHHQVGGRADRAGGPVHLRRGGGAVRRGARRPPGDRRRAERGGRAGRPVPGDRPGPRDQHDRPEHHRHRAPGQAAAAGHGRPGRGQGAGHLVDRLHHAGLVPVGLQRDQVLPAVLDPGVAGGAEGHRRHGDLADAGADRHRLLPPGRDGRHPGREVRRDEGRGGAGRRAGLPGADEGEEQDRRRLGDDQGPGRGEQGAAGPAEGGRAPRDGRAAGRRRV
ncbi:MAG: short chain oxidoreductase, partial [uncultured Corynebacteriales bacterium]